MRDFPDLKDGDELEPWMLNVIYAELRRWRRAKGTNGVTVTGADGGGDPLITGYPIGLGVKFAKIGSSNIAHATSASAPVSGDGTILTFSAATGAVSAAGTAAKLWNYKTDASYLANKIVLVGWADSGWVIFDNAACADLGT